MKPFFLTLIFALLFLACSENIPQEDEIREQLFRKMIQDEAFSNYLAEHQDAFVLKREYCRDNDCHAELLEAGLAILHYNIEDAFMRALKDQIVIREVNLAADRPYLIYLLYDRNRKNQSYKVVL